MPPKLKNTNNPAPTQMRPTPQATSSLGSSEAAPPRAPAKPSTPEKTAAVSNMTSSDFKAELLAALRDEVVGIFKAELKVALKNNFAQIKSELQCVKVELNANMAAIRSEVDVLKIKVKDSTISIFPDFTARTAKARAAFTDIRRQLRDIPNIRFGLLHPARLRITRGDATREFTSPKDAAAFVEALK
ncbi:unnamed protein product [Arctogadus glacialis]